MASPTVMGLEVPRPGSLVFQTMFSFSDHLVGGPLSGLTALPSGPRNWAQSPAATGRPARRSRVSEPMRKRCMEGSGGLDRTARQTSQSFPDQRLLGPRISTLESHNTPNVGSAATIF